MRSQTPDPRVHASEGCYSVQGLGWCNGRGGARQAPTAEIAASLCRPMAGMYRSLRPRGYHMTSGINPLGSDPVRITNGGKTVMHEKSMSFGARALVDA